MPEKATLVKFGQREHLRQFREEGLLYMNNLPYFWRIEEDEVRGDPFDGVSEVRRGRNGTAKLGGDRNQQLRITNWVLRIHPLEPEKINIFCMCAVRPSVGRSPVDEKNLQFGDYAVLFEKPQEFIDRVASGLEPQGIRGKAGLVQYVDEDYEGEWGPLRKLRGFEYQSEWRLVCYDGPGNVRELRIGSLADICAIMDSAEVNERLSEIFQQPG